MDYIRLDGHLDIESYIFIFYNKLNTNNNNNNIKSIEDLYGKKTKDKAKRLR